MTKTVSKKNILRQLQEEALEVKRKQLQKACVDSYYMFFLAFWDTVSPDDLVDNWHIKAICENELQPAGERLARKELKLEDIVINIPPGASKSTMVTVLFPVWLWLRNPTLVVISSSYSGALSIDLSQKSKDVVKSDKFKFLFGDYFVEQFGSPFYLVKDNENYWKNCFGGTRIVTSTGGTITGQHGHLILRDDPINPEQAESEAHRLKALRFNNKTLSMRKRDKAVTLTITVMQRLHQLDQTGYEAKHNKEGNRFVCLPAELTDGVSPPEYKENYVDGLLDPIRLSRKILEDSRKVLGSLGYSCQMQQNPTAEGGNIHKKHWYQVIPQPPKNIVWDMFLDTAYTEKQTNDPTGIMIAGFDIASQRMVVRYFESVYLELPELLKKIPIVAAGNGCNIASVIYIEPKASGHSVKQMLRKQPNINAATIKGKLVQASKTERAHYTAPSAEGGKIVLVDGIWNEAFTTEVCGFPTAEHDEAIDLLAYAARKYLHR